MITTLTCCPSPKLVHP